MHELLRRDDEIELQGSLDAFEFALRPRREWCPQSHRRMCLPALVGVQIIRSCPVSGVQLKIRTRTHAPSPVARCTHVTCPIFA